MDRHAFCDADPSVPDSVEECDACFEHNYQISFRMFKTFADAGFTVKPSKCFLYMHKVKQNRPNFRVFDIFGQKPGRRNPPPPYFGAVEIKKVGHFSRKSAFSDFLNFGKKQLLKS